MQRSALLCLELLVVSLRQNSSSLLRFDQTKDLHRGSEHFVPFDTII